jgi:hypothetical protein
VRNASGKTINIFQLAGGQSNGKVNLQSFFVPFQVKLCVTPFSFAEVPLLLQGVYVFLCGPVTAPCDPYLVGE